MILQQPVEREQMQKLLATGRTDLLTRFVSKRGRRFKAFLVKTPEGRVGFEFEARAPRKTEAREPAAAAAHPRRARASAAETPAAKPAKTAVKPAASKARSKPAKTKRKTT
jgi:DNA topoisomerase-3